MYSPEAFLTVASFAVVIAVYAGYKISKKRKQSFQELDDIDDIQEDNYSKDNKGIIFDKEEKPRLQNGIRHRLEQLQQLNNKANHKNRKAKIGKTCCSDTEYIDNLQSTRISRDGRFPTHAKSMDTISRLEHQRIVRQINDEIFRHKDWSDLMYKELCGHIENTTHVNMLLKREKLVVSKLKKIIITNQKQLQDLKEQLSKRPNVTTTYNRVDEQQSSDISSSVPSILIRDADERTTASLEKRDVISPDDLKISTEMVDIETMNIPIEISSLTASDTIFSANGDDMNQSVHSYLPDDDVELQSNVIIDNQIKDNISQCSEYTIELIAERIVTNVINEVVIMLSNGTQSQEEILLQQMINDSSFSEDVKLLEDIEELDKFYGDYISSLDVSLFNVCNENTEPVVPRSVSARVSNTVSEGVSESVHPTPANNEKSVLTKTEMWEAKLKVSANLSESAVTNDIATDQSNVSEAAANWDHRIKSCVEGSDVILSSDDPVSPSALAGDRLQNTRQLFEAKSNNSDQAYSLKPVDISTTDEVLRLFRHGDENSSETIATDHLKSVDQTKAIFEK